MIPVRRIRPRSSRPPYRDRASDYGGLVYVGAPPYRPPAEADLAAIFEAAAKAGIVWLKFDAGAPVVDGLAVYDDEGDTG